MYDYLTFHSRYALFSTLFQFGYFPELYNRTCLYVCGLVSLQRVFPALTPRYRSDEPVSPNQTTLLKLLDSFLHAVPTPYRDRGDYWNALAGFLASAFHVQAEYTQRAIRQVTGDPLPDQNPAIDVHGSRPHPADYPSDGRLPGVWVALVLLSTSLSSILLAEQEDIDNGGASAGPEVVTSSHGTISASRSRAGTGFIEELLGMMVPWLCIMPPLHKQSFLFLLLETLRLLDRFLPRINFGKVKVVGPSSGLSPPNARGCREAGMGQSAADAAGFPYLKRDLVRLLGVLCHNSKAIQDRIRSCGGIPVVLNLCVIDERNPCKFLFGSCVLACCGRTDACGWRGRDTARFPSHTFTHTSPLCPTLTFGGLIMKI